MISNKIYTPEGVKPLYNQLTEAYKTAFAGQPWFEVSKCADVRKRCIGGLSSLAVGAECSTCGLSTSEPAYEAEELVGRFDELGVSRPTAWYCETEDDDILMAAIAWKSSAGTIAEEKYADTPEMSQWMADLFGEQDVVWLDEVFANRDLRPSGNLKNFGEFVCQLAQYLDESMVAYRTISPQMIRAAERNFDVESTVYERGVDVPDRRDFVVIDLHKDCYTGRSK